MPKDFDIAILNSTIISIMENTFKEMCKVDFTSEPVAVEKDIIEYNSRMRLFPMDKFNGPTYVVAVNYYLSQKDLDASHTIGTFVLFVREDVAEKLLRALGRSSKDAEDEDLLLNSVGEFFSIVAGNFKSELAKLGYADLFMSEPFKYKNTVPDGVQFDYSLFKKQEIVFTFWKEKCIAVEACMGNVPQRGR